MVKKVLTIKRFDVVDRSERTPTIAIVAVVELMSFVDDVATRHIFVHLYLLDDYAFFAL